MEPFDICAIGELLIDFTTSGCDEDGKPVYTANPGGAPANVLAAAQKLGKKTVFFSRASTDVLGDYLVDTLRRAGIDTSGVPRDSAHNTTLALVSNAPGGDRSFSFYRQNTADALFCPEDVQEDLIARCRVLQLGSLMMATPAGKAATERALDLAEKHGLLISFDPNLRPNIWDDVADMIPCVEQVLPRSHMVKVSEEEIAQITGEEDVEKAAARLLEQYPNILLLFVTLGADGCYYRSARFDGRAASYKVQAVDTTGCGDSFTGGALAAFLDMGCPLAAVTREQAAQMAQVGCAVGALVATRYGGILSMPSKEEVAALMG